jgi:hypothetical protein
MISTLYSYYDPADYDLAKSQLAFYQNKIKKLEDDNTITPDNKEFRMKRLKLIVYSIKYTYGL